MTEKKKATAKSKPAGYTKPEPFKCPQCGSPTYQLYAGKCWTCHRETFEES